VDPAVCPFARPNGAWPRDAVHRIGELVDAARTGGVPVVWTRTVEGAPDSPPVLATRWDLAPGEPRLLRGSPGWDWASAQPAPGELVVDKLWPDACSAPELTDWLRARPELVAVVLVGAYAARCVLATANGLARLGRVVLVPGGLVVPHPGCPSEAEVAEHVISTTLGYVLDPTDIRQRWTQPPSLANSRR